MTFSSLIDFTVAGEAVPKQSFRYAKGGRSFQTARVKSWQNAIGVEAQSAMGGREPSQGRLRVTIDFMLAADRADIDNLTKCVLDGMQGIVYKSDLQVKELRAKKWVDKVNPRVLISVEE